MQAVKTIWTRTAARVRLRRSLIMFLAALLAPAWASAANLCVKNTPAAPAIDGIVAPGRSAGVCTSDTLWETVGPAQFQSQAHS